MSSIIFLGTAGSNAVMAKQVRSSGGIILQLDELQLHLDPGPGALNKAKEYGINLAHNTAVLVSHNHLNHCNDLNAVIDAMTHSGLEHHGIVLGSKSVLQPFDGTHPFLTRYHRSLVEKVIPLEKSHKVGIELIEINALPAEHTDPTALGFKFFCPRFTLSYSGDTMLTPHLLDGLAGSDIVILNVPFPGNKATAMNLDTEAAITIVAKVKPKLAILTHFGIEMIKADPMNEARDVQRATGVPTIAATDGLKITPDSYGSRSNVRGYA